MRKPLCVLSGFFLVSTLMLMPVNASIPGTDKDSIEESSFATLDGSIKHAIEVMDKAIGEAESDKEQIEIMIYIGRVLTDIDPVEDQQMKLKLADVESKLIAIKGWLAKANNPDLKQGMGKREEQIHLLLIVKANFNEVHNLLKETMKLFEKQFHK